MKLSVSENQEYFTGVPFEARLESEFDSISNLWLEDNILNFDSITGSKLYFTILEAGKYKIDPIVLGGVESNEAEVFIHENALQDTLEVEIRNLKENCLVTLKSLRLSHVPSIRDFKLINSESFIDCKNLMI